MRAVERTAARNALSHACCAQCRPQLRLWFANSDLDLERLLCRRCLPLVDRLLGELMEHYS